MPVLRTLIDAIRADLRDAADPDRAPGMQRYMKSAMPYLGVGVPRVRAIVRARVRASPPSDADELVDTVRALWHEASAREERYAATELLAVPTARSLRTPDFMELYAELIVDGAWWDHVDGLAPRVGELVLQFPALVKPVVRNWQTDTDMWLRRVSIICQLGHKKRTDVTLLTDAVEANATDREFFIRKAIGWALRDYARTEPGWVRAFVAEHELSPLSAREATKHLVT